MPTPRIITYLAIWIALALTNANAHAASLEAKAEGDFDTDFIFELQDIDSENGSPVARTTVSVAGFGTSSGINYDYAAASDIANSSLGAYGSLTNLGGAIGGELPLLRSTATFTDTLFFDSTLAGDYDVTFVMNVSGEIDESGGDVLANAVLDIDGDASGSDAASYSTDGQHIDTLTVTVTLNGNASLDITADLLVAIFFLEAGGTASGDFRGGLGDNGADIVLMLPNGVDLTGSDSGAYDTGVVPLPAAGWLLLSGLVMSAAARRKQR